jgi:Zn-dependent protease with chaperone function
MNSASQLVSDQFPATAFAPGQGSKVLKGEITLGSGQVNFKSASGQVSLPLSGILIRAGGHNDGQIFFEHPNHPGWVLVSKDASAARHPALEGLIDRKLAGARQRTHRRFVTVAAGSLLFLAIFFCLGIFLLISQKENLVRGIANKIPVSKEIEIGDKLFASAKSEWTFVDDPALNQRLGEVTNQFHSIMGSSPYPFRFHIIHEKTLNAFAMPGGNIVIHDELLKRFDSSGAIAGVLAHEMAHVTERHSLRSLIESSGLYILMQAFLGDADRALGLFRDGSRLLLERKFSRGFEREADNRGWDYMVESGIDPAGMIEGFKKLKAEMDKEGQGEEIAFGLLSTHGSIDERIRNLEAKLEARRRLKKQG